MAAQFSEATQMQTPRIKPSSALEKSLGELRTQVECVKQQLRASFLHIHEMLGYREAELMLELSEIPDRMSRKIEERQVSLDQLTLHKYETEQQLQANRLSDFLKIQLTNIEAEMEKIISENIHFPHVILNLDKQQIQEQINNTGHIIRAEYEKYGTEPVWSGVKGGKKRNELSVPTALCVDPIMCRP